MNEFYILHFITFIYFFDHLVMSIFYWFYLAEYVEVKILVQFYGFQLLCFEAFLRVSSALLLYWKRFWVNYLRFLMIGSGLLGIVFNIIYFIRPPIIVLIITRSLSAFHFFAINLFHESLKSECVLEEISRNIITKRLVQCLSSVCAGVVAVLLHFFSVNSNVLQIRSTNALGLFLSLLWFTYTIYAVMVLCSTKTKDGVENIKLMESFIEDGEKHIVNRELNINKRNIFSIFNLFYILGLLLSVSTRLTLNFILAPICSVIFKLSSFYVTLIFLGLCISNLLIFPTLRINSKCINNSIKLVLFSLFIMLGFLCLISSLVLTTYNIAGRTICTSIFIMGYFLTNITQYGCHVLLQCMIIIDLTSSEQNMINQIRRSFLAVGCLLGVLLGPGLLIWPTKIFIIFGLLWMCVFISSFIFYEGHNKVIIRSMKK